jgi:uncharacterized phage-like protein YoqJ
MAMTFNPQNTALCIGLSDFNSLTCIETSKIALKRMVARAKELGYTTFFSGMELGTEQWAAAFILDDPELQLVAIPRRHSKRSWGWTQQKMYQKLLDASSSVLTLETDAHQWMCDRSSLVLAVWDGTEGDIANCLAYAKALGLAGMIFNPKTVDYSKL